jgi:hypothetical protein
MILPEMFLFVVFGSNSSDSIEKLKCFSLPNASLAKLKVVDLEQA